MAAAPDVERDQQRVPASQPRRQPAACSGQQRAAERQPAACKYMNNGQ
jgi:hypothetical protein